jgi:hypothetical protein
MTRNRAYLNTQGIAYVADFPGARVETNRIGTVLERSEATLDVSAATVPVEIVADSATETTQQHASQEVNSLAYEDVQTAGPVPPDSVPIIAEGPGGVTQLTGIVEASGTYDVMAVFGDPDKSLTHVMTIASDVSGGTTTPIDETALTPEGGVFVTDKSGDTTNTVTGEVHLA